MSEKGHGHQGEDVSEDAAYFPELIDIDKGIKGEVGRKSMVHSTKQWKNKCKMTNTKTGVTYLLSNGR